MKVILKRDFILGAERVSASSDPVDIPDGTVLPRDAVVVEPAKRGRPRKAESENFIGD